MSAGMETKSTQELISAVVDGHDQLIARMYLAAALINEGAKVEAEFKQLQSKLAQANAALAEVERECAEVEQKVSTLREEEARLTGVINEAKERLAKEILAEQIKEEAA